MGARFLRGNPTRLTWPALFLLACMAPVACSRSGPSQRGGGTPGATAGQQHARQAAGANAGVKPNAGGQSQSSFTEPTSSVSGMPSTASDNGSPGAVADRSIAEPGAPEGTLKGKKPAQAPRSASTAPHP